MKTYLCNGATKATSLLTTTEPEVSLPKIFFIFAINFFHSVADKVFKGK
jgi:hypothetical protein